MKKQIFDFIKRKKPNLIKVLEFKLKDTDDEHGMINEHYVVRCLLETADPSFPLNNTFGKTERICLVNVSEFNSWLRSEDSIKWI